MRSEVATSLLVLGLISAVPAEMERRVALMGTVATLRTEAASPASARAASEAALRALEATERRLSTWTERSELERVNQAPVGEPIVVSAELASDLAQAWHCREVTSGGFEPAAGPLVQAWGIRQGGRRPGSTELAAAEAATGPSAWRLDGDRVTRLHPGARLDEGGFGKGLAEDVAIERAVAAGSSRVEIDLGGQIAWHGAGLLEVALVHPILRTEVIALLTIPPGSIATSGNSERGLVIEGRSVSHVVDPDVGIPSSFDGSVTVWAENGFWADCLSTGLFALGPEGALAWARLHPWADVVVTEVVAGRLRIRASAGWHGRIRPLDPSISIDVAPAPRLASHPSGSL